MYRFEPENQQQLMEIYSRYVLALAFVLLLTRWLTRKTDPSFSWSQLGLAMGLKIAMGSFYGWLFLHQYGGDDTWMINAESKIELEKLLNRTNDFFEDIDLLRLADENGWRQGLALFKDKLELALLIKPLALGNLWSQGNYYINVVFFSAISFWGHFWLYRAVTAERPAISKWAYLVIFLYPPAVFWLSGIRADAWLFLFFALVCRQFQLWLFTRRVGALLLLALGLTGMLVIRSSFGLLMLPVLAALALAATWQKPTAKMLAGVYALCILLFFASAFLPDGLNAPAAVAKKQLSFFALHGQTRVSIDTLDSGAASFLRALPKAADNILLRPYPLEAVGFLQYGLVLQNMLVIVLVLLVILRRYPGRTLLNDSPLFTLLFIFSVTVYLSIGYTIPFPGAAVRYRAIAEICLVFLLTIAASGERLTNYNFFNVYKKNIN
jgi:hypothetical protein